jgi:dTDP-4-dehydrorhamnose reductase
MSTPSSLKEGAVLLGRVEQARDQLHVKLLQRRSEFQQISREELTGLYHATGPASLSRYEFTVQAAETFGFDPDLIESITTEELGQEAPRPADSTLDSTALYETLGWAFRDPTAAFAAMRERSA